MRITGGLYRGRCLRCPQQDIRPVMSKMRESLFSSLVSQWGSLQGLRFLDLFCGSAIMSVEAASRGAGYIEAVERDRRKKKILEENLQMLEVPWNLHILNVLRYFEKRTESTDPFDIIYLDPPFGMQDKASVLQKLPAALLQRNGSMVLIHLPKNETESLPGNLLSGPKLEHIKYYGGSGLAIYQN